MQETKEDKLDYKGTEIHYSVSGTGNPFILMHGWGCNSSTVASIANIALECGYKVYNIDLPGFGKSEEPSDVWGVEEYTKSIEFLIQKENIVEPVVAGHSFGGRIAILLSSRNDTKKVVLIDSAGIKPHRSLSYYVKIYSFKTLKVVLKYLLKKEEYERVINKLRAKRGSSDYAGASSKMRQILSKVVNEDLTNVVSSIKSPTLLMWGELDSATPIKDAIKMQKLIPDSGLVVFEGAGHYSFLEQPLKFKAALKYFLTH